MGSWENIAYLASLSYAASSKPQWGGEQSVYLYLGESRPQPGCGLQLTWVPGLRLSGQAGSTRTTRFSVGAALRASAVEWKLSSSAPCRPFFSTGPSHCPGGLRLGAMPVAGYQRGASGHHGLCTPPVWYSTSLPQVTSYCLPHLHSHSQPQTKTRSLHPRFGSVLSWGGGAGQNTALSAYLGQGRVFSLLSSSLVCWKVIEKVKGESPPSHSELFLPPEHSRATACFSPFSATLDLA